MDNRELLGKKTYKKYKELCDKNILPVSLFTSLSAMHKPEYTRTCIMYYVMPAIVESNNNKYINSMFELYQLKHFAKNLVLSSIALNINILIMFNIFLIRKYKSKYIHKYNIEYLEYEIEDGPTQQSYDLILYLGQCGFIMPITDTTCRNFHIILRTHTIFLL